MTASLSAGIDRIKEYADTLPGKPGVYRMLNARGQVLYVGKAKHLKNRVTSYTQAPRLTVRLKRMVSETTAMEFVVTNTEVEALLLEANLIKKLRPAYNILLMDDKFFSYLLITEHAYPRLTKYRGDKSEKGTYFGPFASTYAVNQALTSLYKVFKVRSCTDSFFASRKRPCLQYYIKRCSAPCVGHISQPDYDQSVRQAIEFLNGKTSEIQKELANQMSTASDAQEYERAAFYRDQIQALTQLQSQQNIYLSSLKDSDVFAIVQHGGKTCIQSFFFRNGSHYGSHSFFPQHTEELSEKDLLAEFLALFYEDKTPPAEVLVNINMSTEVTLQAALTYKRGKDVSLLRPTRGAKLKVIQDAERNALEALEREALKIRSDKKFLRELADFIHIENDIERVEVYDNSHISGTNAIGAFITAGPSGFERKHYRKFMIRSAGPDKEITPGDDYGMMREVLSRRFHGGLAADPTRNPIPDLIIIDGGQGQLNTALDVMNNLGINIPVLAIAKGPDRNAGNETFFMAGMPAFKIRNQQSLLFYLQRLRDEAHRFAISYHRSKRSKAIRHSQLDDIPGIGAGRKKALLRHFGSSFAVKDAGIDDLMKVEGISENIAKTIYNFFHPA
jgi:excinuclease ABC subunit C